MQLMCDALAVPGSRHGLLVKPMERSCGIIRFDPFHELPAVEIRAGAVIEGVEYVFPLCRDGERFTFLDQRLSPCSMSFIGLHADTALKVKLTIVAPFRPRDAAFSTTPALGLRVEVMPMNGHYRWQTARRKIERAEAFLEVLGPEIQRAEAGGDAVDLCFTSTARYTKARPDGTVDETREPLLQRDRLVALRGRREGLRFVQSVDLTGGERASLDVAWCTHSGPVLNVRGSRVPFKYASRFANLDAVAAWARRDGGELFESARRVDGIVAANTLSKSVNDLLAYTLHSWMIDTWWGERGGGRDWFSVWEGNCYFHSTVDVEYTQAPFYLAAWPELLAIELDAWPEYSKDGRALLGERGAGTLFLSHDCGSLAAADGQIYPHDMEVEETSNYLILLYAHWRRTGDDRLVRAKEDIVRRYLQFLVACDTTGNGVPDRGVANTIDDASPAVQFGREQVYLAVKTVAAFETGAAMLERIGDAAAARPIRERAAAVRRLIEEKGWQGDHYAVLLDKGGKGIKNPWSGRVMDLAEIPGWDAPHIYTENGMAVLDLVGLDLGLSPERIRTDLRVAAERCLREYGCVHTDYVLEAPPEDAPVDGLAGSSLNPGWIAMNMLRDIAAFYRGVDLRALADRYWQWQVTANTQQPMLFFETFNGNNLHFYPRGVAIWGYFDAVGGCVIDRVAGVDRQSARFPGVRVPRLFDADWLAGTCAVIE